MVSEITQIATSYGKINFDFNDEGIDVEGFGDFQKRFAMCKVILPTRQRIEKYINDSLNDELIFTNLKERLRLHYRNLEKEYFPEIDFNPSYQ